MSDKKNQPPATERVPHKWEIWLVKSIGYASFLICMACSGIEVYRAVHAINLWKDFHSTYNALTVDKSNPFILAGFVPETDQPLDQAIGGPWRALQGAYVFNPTFHLICSLVLAPIALSELPNSKLWHHTLRKGSCLQFLGKPNTTFHVGLLQLLMGASSWGRRPTDNWSLFPTGYILAALGGLNLIFTPLYGKQIWNMRAQYAETKPPEEKKEEKTDEEEETIISPEEEDVESRQNINVTPVAADRLRKAYDGFLDQVFRPGTTNSLTGEVVIQISTAAAKKALSELDKEVKNAATMINEVSNRGYQEDGSLYTVAHARQERGDTGPPGVTLSTGVTYGGTSNSNNFGYGGGNPFGNTMGVPSRPAPRVTMPAPSGNAKPKESTKERLARIRKEKANQ